MAAARAAAVAATCRSFPRAPRCARSYVTERGDAFVDLSREVSAAIRAGRSPSCSPCHAIVNAVTANLPAVQRVQILVDGKEVDTLAGHVDIRRPLLRDVSLVRELTPCRRAECRIGRV